MPVQFGPEDYYEAYAQRRQNELGPDEKPAVPAWLQTWCDLHSLSVSAVHLGTQSEQTYGGWYWRISPSADSPYMSCIVMWWKSLDEIRETVVRRLGDHYAA